MSLLGTNIIQDKKHPCPVSQIRTPVGEGVNTVVNFEWHRLIFLLTHQLFNIILVKLDVYTDSSNKDDLDLDDVVRVVCCSMVSGRKV